MMRCGAIKRAFSACEAVHYRPPRPRAAVADQAACKTADSSQIEFGPSVHLTLDQRRQQDRTILVPDGHLAGFELITVGRF
jgi:hypothetical protein